MQISKGADESHPGCSLVNNANLMQLNCHPTKMPQVPTYNFAQEKKMSYKARKSQPTQQETVATLPDMQDTQSFLNYTNIKIH